MRTLGPLWVLCVAVALTVSLVGPAVLASSADEGTDAFDSRVLPTTPEYMRFVNINGFEFDPCDAAPQVPAGLAYGPDVTGGFGYYIAQFSGPVTQTMKNDLYSTGAELLFYVNYNAFVVRADANVLLEIGELSTVRWVGIFEPAYKLSPRLSEEFDDVLAKYSEGGVPRQRRHRRGHLRVGCQESAVLGGCILVHERTGTDPHHGRGAHIRDMEPAAGRGRREGARRDRHSLLIRLVRQDTSGDRTGTSSTGSPSRPE